MKKHTGSILASFIVFFPFFVAILSCDKSEAQQSGDAPTLVMKECTDCHDTMRICTALGKKDKQAWHQTVTQMVKNGADVKQENIPVIAEYLSSLKPGSPPVCK